MIDTRNVVRLMDFGISRTLADNRERVTRTGLLVGTPNYMSPESILNRDDLDFRSDIYSLGGTLYHVLTGQLPYAGRNFADTLRRRGSREPLPHPQDVNPSLSEPCVSLLNRMLDPDPAGRPPSWQGLISDIERTIRGEMPRPATGGIPAGRDRAAAPSERPPNALRRSLFATRLLSRHRRKTVALLLLIAGTLFVLDVFLILRIRARWRAQRSPVPPALESDDPGSPLRRPVS
jgi:serine/threonine protein kinase